MFEVDSLGTVFFQSDSMCSSTPAGINGLSLVEFRDRVNSADDGVVTVISGIRSVSGEGQGPRNYALIQLILQAGLRVQELVNLVGEDLSIQQRSGTLHVRSDKEFQERLVPLNSKARRALKQYFEKRGIPQATEAVFLSTRGHAVAKRTVQYVVERCAERANIDRISVGPQTLRHTCALRFLDEHPADQVGLAELLGHDRLETIAIYVRPERQ